MTGYPFRWLLVITALQYGLLDTRSHAVEESYPVPPESLVHEGVPVGDIIEGSFADSAIFPGTVRSYWIYVPKQYKPDQSAALMVFQDGQGYAKRDGEFKVPTVFDNLIHKGAMPVTIGLFINPGVVPALHDEAQARFNRSFEYDSMDDRYATFLVQEMLPLLEKRHQLQVTDNPNLRAISGASSGGICALAAAWHRPDQFRRVFTTVGTYVGLRGAHEFSTLIRKVEPKPLRVFLQDGSNDNNIFGGDWWMANQAMLRSLQFAGYEVEHAWGEGGHNGKHGAAIFPTVMRWLWKDYATTAVKTHPEGAPHEIQRFFPDSVWELVSEGHQWAEGMAFDEKGTLYFTDVPASKLYKIGDDGKPILVIADTGNANGIAWGPDGRIYAACNGARQIRAWDPTTLAMEVIVDQTDSNDIVVRSDGMLYYTDPTTGTIWMVRPGTHERVVADLFEQCNGIALSADQTQLLVAHFPGRFIYSYQAKPDGVLAFKQPYFHADVPINTLEGHLDGLCSTEDGWVVATSEMGVQVFDPPGRTHVILPMPLGSARPCYARFGGEKRDVLYVANVDKIWRRKSTLVGARPWASPVKPPVPRL